MDTVLFVFLGFIFLVLIGGSVFLYLAMKDNKKRIAENKGVAAVPSTTQSFLPFNDIVDSMIVMDNYEYRMVVECNSINYFLKTEDEQDAVEIAFRRFLNSIKFPFSIYVQTREIDNRAMIDSLRKDMEVTLRSYPQLRDYGNYYVRELQSINDKLKSTKFKKKYIIVTFDEAGKMTNLNDAEKKEYAFDELFNRCKLVINGLSNVGIKAKVLDSSELANMVYQSMHKEVGSVPDDVMNGAYMSLLVKGKAFRPLSPASRIDAIISEYKNRLSTEIIGDNAVDEKYKEAASHLMTEVDKDRYDVGRKLVGDKGRK